MLCTAQMIERYVHSKVLYTTSTPSIICNKKIFKKTNKTRRPFSLMDLDFLSFCFWKWNRKDTNNLQNVGTAASKLLYTLHWTLLDAAEECADADREAGVAPREPFPYIFPLTCIQVLYLFLFFVFVFSFLSLCLFVFTFLMATKWQRTFISPCPKFVIEFLLSLLFFSKKKKKRNSFTFLLRYVTCWKKPICKTSDWRMDSRSGQPCGIIAIQTLSALRHPSDPKRAQQSVRKQPTMQRRRLRWPPQHRRRLILFQ